eukprot:scaffold825_cov249-Pinguiococcus_pyrenoidosus.AAC.27
MTGPRRTAPCFARISTLKRSSMPAISASPVVEIGCVVVVDDVVEVAGVCVVCIRSTSEPRALQDTPGHDDAHLVPKVVRVEHVNIRQMQEAVLQALEGVGAVPQDWRIPLATDCNFHGSPAGQGAASSGVAIVAHDDVDQVLAVPVRCSTVSKRSQRAVELVYTASDPQT